MAKFRKKPVVVEAWQWNGCLPQGEMHSALCASKQDWRFSAGDQRERPSFQVRTLENDKDNWHVASIGDWMMRGVNGEIYFCKPDIFAATYEPAE